MGEPVNLRDRDEAYAIENCSVARALQVVGTKSAMLLLREAFFGTRRFDDFARRVGMTEAVAAARLRDLVNEGLLRKEPYREEGQRTRMEYRITSKGVELLPVILALLNWGDKWLADEGGGPIAVSHRDCGEPIVVEIGCAAGHHVNPRDIEVALR